MKGDRTKWYAKPIYLMLALALVFSLGVVAVPMAGTVEANGPVENIDTGETFSTIQAAIDDADTLDGHTINVAAGTYNSTTGEVFPITVNKANLTIQATGAAVNTVIDAGGAVNAITLSADGVTIDGFKVTGSDPDALGNGAIQVNSNDNTIRNNIVTANRWVGIQLNSDTNYNTISGNNVYNNGADGYVGTPIEWGGIGIYLYEHNTYNTITNNIANENYHDGICLHDQSSYNTITDNTANNSVWCNGIGIRNPSGGDNMTGNIITGNTANGNHENGIGLGDSEDTTIRDNTANNNVQYDGIRLTNSDDNTIEDNTTNNNGRHGIMVYNGSDNNTVTGNTASNNTDTGIRIQWASTNNTIANNTCNENGHGIYLEEDSNNNTIRFNTITNNALLVDSGVHVDTGCADNHVNYNNIEGNAPHGVYNNPGNPELDATNNWWGAKDGPSGAGPGSGDAVSDNVDYDSWLGAELTEVESKTISGSGTMTDTSTGGDVIVNASGDHTITTAKYAENPGGPCPFTNEGAYYDVHLDSATGVNSLTIQFCPAYENEVICYWDGASWVPASNQVYSDGCIVVTITDETDPGLSALTGLPFGQGFPTPVGGEAYPVNKLAILAPWIAIAMAIIAGASLLVLRHRKTLRLLRR